MRMFLYSHFADTTKLTMFFLSKNKISVSQN